MVRQRREARTEKEGPALPTTNQCGGLSRRGRDERETAGGTETFRAVPCMRTVCTSQLVVYWYLYSKRFRHSQGGVGRGGRVTEALLQGLQHGMAQSGRVLFWEGVR